jgi:predicted nucleic acid-binding protein
MADRVYIETSIISYLAARPSRDLITAARQQITHDWWARRRPLFDICISEVVVLEASAGDESAAQRRNEILRELHSLAVSDDAVELSEHLVIAAGLPAGAKVDALHIAVAACNGIDYLLTWNSTHIANAQIRPRVERACRDRGFEPPILCTPDELMGS